jgi:hypothetical protein
MYLNDYYIYIYTIVALRLKLAALHKILYCTTSGIRAKIRYSDRRLQ